MIPPAQLTDQQISTAAKVIVACKQLDPWFAKTRESLARGWASIFCQHPYTAEELLGGVLEFYAHAKAGEHAMPGDILRGAKTTRNQLIATRPGYKEQLEQARQQRRLGQDKRLAAANPTPPELEATPEQVAHAKQLVGKLVENVD